MFVAVKEIRAAWGRFGLMVAVVAMIALLLVVLTALTQGLGHQSTSAVEALPADRVVLTPAAGTAAYDESVVTAAQARTWSSSGARVEPLVIGRSRAARGDQVAGVALFGGGTDVAPGAVVLAEDSARALGASVGDDVTLDGRALRVARVEPTEWYSHQPVARVALATASGRLPTGTLGTALLVTGTVDAAALDRRAGTVSMTPAASVSALSGYRSEHGSLLLIQAFLYGISALVVVAFVSVWTIQRTRDLAVIRALGASRRFLLVDSLGQAGILLLVGTLAGAAVGAVVVLLVGRAGPSVPVLAQPLTIATPVLGIVALGLLGSLVATRRVIRVDPLLALGGN